MSPKKLYNGISYMVFKFTLTFKEMYHKFEKIIEQFISLIKYVSESAKESTMNYNSEEYVVTIDSNLLRRSRQSLEHMTDKPSPTPEILLAVASVALGGVMGALQGGVTIASSNWWIFFVVMPVLA